MLMEEEKGTERERERDSSLEGARVKARAGSSVGEIPPLPNPT